MPPIISVENLGKRYPIRHQQPGCIPYQALRDVLTDKTKSLARRLWSALRHPASSSPANSRPSTEDFWALKNVSFEVHQGDVVGILGRNGAGKSTLLKILSRITEPTEGRVTLRGKVASLLEVGTGFHPELTGRENIFLNGAILGMTRAELRGKFDQIVAFADVDKFLDTPVKRYSSGMYVRLAFAVAANLQSELLLVDEVLAVGDLQFQNRCLGRIGEEARQGRTVLFVSHNVHAVRTLCPRSMLLAHGRLASFGGTDAGLEQYAAAGSQGSETWERRPQTARSAINIQSVACRLEGSQPFHRLSVAVELASRRPHKPAFIAMDILDRSGMALMQAIPTLEPFLCDSRESHHIHTLIDLPPMVPGRYSLSIWIGPHFTETYDEVQLCVDFEITTSPTPQRTVPHTSDHGFIVPASRILKSNR